MSRRGALWIAGCLLTATPSGVAAQSETELEVVEIGFEGNERIAAEELRTAILTASTSCRSFLFKFPFPLCPLTDVGFAHRRRYLEPGELPKDLLRLHVFYRQRGFRQATVDTLVEREGGTASITFRIAEGEPTLVRSLEVEGGTDLVPADRQRALLGIAQGDPLNLARLTLGEGRLTDALRDEGYVDAVVLREYFIPTGSLEADLTLRVVPGPRVRVGDVRIEGSADIGDDIVRTLLEFDSGDVFRDDEIIESQRRLYNLEALRFASITSERRDDTDTLIDLRIEVTPAPRRTVNLGFGAETDECVQVQAGLTNRNFLGAGRVVRLTARLSNLFARQLEGKFPCTDVSDEAVFQELNYRLAATFEQPVFTGGRNSVRATIYGEEETVPDLFVRQSIGGELALTHRLSPQMVLTVAGRPELTSFGEDSADIYFCINFGFCTPEDIGVLSQKRWLSPIALLWALNRTDDPFSATRGYYATVELEVAGGFTGSDYRYVRSTVDAAAFRRIGQRRVLAGHVRFGWIDPSGTSFSEDPAAGTIVHPRKRFFAGGAASVRGFGANLLGPTVLVVDASRDCPDTPIDECVDGLSPAEFDERPAGGNAVIEGGVELRSRLSPQWTFVVFVDAGQVWRGLRDRSDVIVTPGVGVRFRSPIGPLRLDFGYDPSNPPDKPVVILTEEGEIQELGRTIAYDPFGFDDPDALTEILRRLQIQLSIGEAF